MCNSALFDSGHHKNKWCYAIETVAEVYNNVRHSSHNETPNFLWLDTRISINDFRVWGCQVYVKNQKRKTTDSRIVKGYFMGYTNSRVIMRWWNPATEKKYY